MKLHTKPGARSLSDHIIALRWIGKPACGSWTRRT